MRYLNRIIFINSASVKYAEIEMDGNVHFIGTQGVGKSTLLRAILFFYNADKTKLGIPREKKRFDEYYFEWQNSYIIYEIVKDDIPYCVLAFKQNGRVAFRFFNSEYRKEFFIDQDGRAFETWDKTRKAFGANTYYTRVISNYDEFRRIIYGDNKGMKSEFRKYAILESKQFQNIPRTIQNVLLNTKLEAQFIKETIIKSLNEEEIKIDLSNYSKSHLRDFETELNDIKIWFKKNRKGQIVVRKQAESVIENSRILNFLKQDKKELAKKLAKRINYVTNQKPLSELELITENRKLVEANKKLANLNGLHLKREQKIISDINLRKSKLEEAKQKHTQYENQNINGIITKVSEKDNLNNEQNTKLQEKTLLTSRFSEINQKYESLISQLQNHQSAFFNQKASGKNKCNNDFIIAKNEIFDAFRLRVEKLKKDNQERLDIAKNEIDSFKEQENVIKQKRAELKHKVFFKSEIEQNEKDRKELEQAVLLATNEINSSKTKIGAYRKEWELEEKEIIRQFESAQGKQNEIKANYQSTITGIQNKIEQSKTSLYGWLNDNYPNWEDTIGKVIDEEHVLFNKELNPQLLEKNSNSFFGLEINLSALQNRVKSVAEYNTEIETLRIELNEVAKSISKINEKKFDDLSNLKLRFRKKISALNDNISQKDYQKGQSGSKLKQNKIDWNDLQQKEKDEKKSAKKSIEEQLDKVTKDKFSADGKLSQIEKEIKRQINQKEKDRDTEIGEKKLIKTQILEKLELEITDKKSEVQKRLVEIQNQQNLELDSKGADTKRLNEISTRLEEIKKDLEYISNNEITVIEFNKDKRELFDKVPDIKAERLALENKHDSMQKEHVIEKEKLIQKSQQQKQKVDVIKDELRTYETDLTKFEEFEKSEAYNSVKFLIFEITDITENLETASSIVSQVNDTHYNSITQFNELQKSIIAFIGNFNEHNIFSFKTRFIADNDYLDFATDLKEFVEEDKIYQYEKRINERFAHIIQLIGKETDELISKEAEIEKVIKKINDDFVAKNFVGAIKSMEMRIQDSSNKIVKLLLEIKGFNDNNSFSMGTANLFNVTERDSNNQKAVELLKQLVKELEQYKSNVLTLSESFDLQFKIVENDNDSGWVEKLSNVGSEGTDILVKAMINILLLNVFKESASKKFKDFKLHCMMDEVGRLHPNNVKGILRFANDRNILLINGSPTSYNATDYRYTYILSNSQSKTNDKKYVTKISRLVKATAKQQN